MAKNQPNIKPVPKETEKPLTAEEIFTQLSYQVYTIEHIYAATGHIRELSTMLYEAQDSNRLKYCNDVARAVQDLMGTYADEIDECVEYFDKLTKAASALRKQTEKGSAQ